MLMKSGGAAGNRGTWARSLGGERSFSQKATMTKDADIQACGKKKTIS